MKIPKIFPASIDNIDITTNPAANICNIRRHFFIWSFGGGRGSGQLHISIDFILYIIL